MALSEITVPDSVTELGAASFYNCRALSKAVIGNGIDKLESSGQSFCLQWRK